MLRKKVLLITVVLTVLFLVVFTYLARTISYDIVAGSSSDAGNSMNFVVQQLQAGAFMVSLGFFFGSFVVAFLAIFSSISVISGEAEQGELQAVMSRPLSRMAWYSGRWLGLVSIGSLYAILLFTAIIAIAEMVAAVPGNIWTLLTALLLFASTVPLLVSIAMYGSTYFSAMGNGVFMMMLYGTSWLGGMLEKVIAVGAFAHAREKLEMVSGLISMAMPADALQRRMLAELLSVQDVMALIDLEKLGPFGFGQIPSNAFLLYALLYTAAALVLGIRRFQRKDL